MGGQEKIYDYDVAGKQMGRSVKILFRPEIVNWIEDVNDQLPKSTKDPVDSWIYWATFGGWCYLRFYGKKEGATAVEFEIGEEKLLVGNKKETNPNKIINWERRAKLGKGLDKSPDFEKFIEGRWIWLFQDLIEKAEKGLNS